jgi:uncharacterized protein
MAAGHAFIRTVHTYGSMLAAVLVLLFAVTGLLLNHAARLGLEEDEVTCSTATVPAALVKAADPDRAGVVEALCQSCEIWGDVESFEVEPDSIRIVFSAPGRRTDAVIARTDGRAEITQSSRGTAGTLLDLHRGKHAGAGWRILMDALAVLLAISAVTGIILCFAHPRRRGPALAILAASSAVILAIYFLLI